MRRNILSPTEKSDVNSKHRKLVQLSGMKSSKFKDSSGTILPETANRPVEQPNQSTANKSSAYFSQKHNSYTRE